MPTTKHVTDLLHEQHAHIQTLFDRVMEAPNRTRRSEAFEELRRYKVAEGQTWAHPVLLGRDVVIRDADSVAVWSLS